MADNKLKQIWKTLTTKGNYSPLQWRYQTPTHKFRLFDNFFSWDYGKINVKKYFDAYGENPIVYMVVHKVSYSSASIKRVAVNEKGEEITNSRILELLNNPNSEHGEIEFRDSINESLLLSGNAFIRLVRGVGMGEELRLLHAQCVEIECNSLGEVAGYKYHRPEQTEYIYLEPEEVLHIKTSNVVNIEGSANSSYSYGIKWGLSPLQAAWIIVQSSMEKFKAEASIFKNRGIAGIITNKSDRPMLADERERLQEEFDEEAGGAEKFNKLKISTVDLNYIQTGMSPTDLKLLDGIVSSLRHICSIYGVSSILFNDNDNSTYNNIVEARKDAYTEAYIPLANKVDKELTKFLNEQLNVNEFLKLDLSTIQVLKSSTNKLATDISSLNPKMQEIVATELTADEARSLVNLEPRPEGEQPIGSQNTSNETQENN